MNSRDVGNGHHHAYKIEIEIKAHITSVDDIASKLKSVPQAQYVGAVDKKDCYYTIVSVKDSAKNNQVKEFRLRHDGGCFLCTTKKSLSAQNIDQNIEINNEIEFRVDDPNQFVAFAEQIGATPSVQKHKQGQAWRWCGYLVEIVEVATLGAFIELEALIDGSTYTPQLVAKIKEDFQSLLHRLAIDTSQIETRRYIDMLKTRTHTKPTSNE